MNRTFAAVLIWIFGLGLLLMGNALLYRAADASVEFEMLWGAMSGLIYGFTVSPLLFGWVDDGRYR